jgi:hypothetical protein
MNKQKEKKGLGLRPPPQIEQAEETPKKRKYIKAKRPAEIAENSEIIKPTKYSNQLWMLRIGVGSRKSKQDMVLEDGLSLAVKQLFLENAEDFHKKKLFILVKVLPHPKEPFLMKLKKHVAQISLL